MFIIFLFYSNLLMGEFTVANGHRKTMAFALNDIFTRLNFLIAAISAMIGYVVFDTSEGRDWSGPTLLTSQVPDGCSLGLEMLLELHKLDESLCIFNGVRSPFLSDTCRLG